jgi:hypothetical protein
MASQLSSSYLDNKLKSLRGASGPVTGGTIRASSPGIAARYPTLDTVSTQMSFGGGQTTFQPSFVNRESYFPVQIGDRGAARRSPVIGSTYQTESRPLASYSREKSYEPIRTSSPMRSIATTNYTAMPAKNYELKANPEIYSLAGYSSPASPVDNYTAPVTSAYQPSFSGSDLKRLISPHEESAILNNMKNEMMKFDVDHFQTGGLGATQEEVRSLKERLPLERQTTQRLENTMIEQLLEEDVKRQTLTQKLMERDSQLRQLTSESTSLEKEVRLVGLSD